MGAYNFKPQFEADIMADRKRHTIRAKRKYPDKPGSICHLFVGMKTKKCRLLKRRRCVKVQHIEIHWHPGFWIVIDGEKLTRAECENLARSDGFPTFIDMMRYWETEKNLPFTGDLIHWESDEEWRKRETARVMDRWQPPLNPPLKNSPWKRRQERLKKARQRIARESR